MRFYPGHYTTVPRDILRILDAVHGKYTARVKPSHDLQLHDIFWDYF